MKKLFLTPNRIFDWTWSVKNVQSLISHQMFRLDFSLLRLQTCCVSYPRSPILTVCQHSFLSKRLSIFTAKISSFLDFFPFRVFFSPIVQHEFVLGSSSRYGVVTSVLLGQFLWLPPVERGCERATAGTSVGRRASTRRPTRFQRTCECQCLQGQYQHHCYQSEFFWFSYLCSFMR